MIHVACSELGIPVVLGKKVKSCQIIEFLGLLIDALLMIARITQDKLDNIV